MREHGLDWLRVAAFAVLIFYHSGMIYVPWEFHIKNPETSETLALVMVFFNRWRLPLLFFISGCGVAFSLRRRSLSEFARERLWRLLLPLVFGMFVIVPPQIYVERLQKGATFSYAEFYPEVLRLIPYPAGSFSWHHLWFVMYLLVYSLAAIPLFGALRGFGAALAVQITRWPTTHNLTEDWANLTGSFITFLWGFVFASTPALLDIVERRRREFLAGAFSPRQSFYALRPSGTCTSLGVDVRATQPRRCIRSTSCTRRSSSSPATGWCAAVEYCRETGDHHGHRVLRQLGRL